MKIYAAMAILLVVTWGCRPPAGENEAKYQGSLNLPAFLKENITDMAHHEIDFQVLDKDGKPVPYALLRMDWKESGARMSFQTNAQGIIGMHFDKEMLENDVDISADVKPMGQHVMAEAEYDVSTNRLTDGYIRVSW